MRVLVAGHLCLDFFPALDDIPGHEPGELYRVGPMPVRLGGAVSTTGAALRALGVDIALAAAVGDDALAGLQRELLAQRGLDDSRMSRVAAPTSYSLVLQPPGADRTFWHHAGSNELFNGADLDLDGIDVLHLGYPNLLPALLADDGRPLRELCDRAHERGILTSVDLAVLDAGDRDRPERWEAFFATTGPAIDILTPSVDDLRSALGWTVRADPDGLAEAAQRMLDNGIAVIMVTGGTAGLHVAATGDADRLAGLPVLPQLAAAAGESHHVPAAEVTQISGTTGAGDTATAGFLAALIGGAGLVEAGVRAATLAARHVAGQPLTDD